MKNGSKEYLFLLNAKVNKKNTQKKNISISLLLQKTVFIVSFIIGTIIVYHNIEFLFSGKLVSALPVCVIILLIIAAMVLFLRINMPDKFQPLIIVIVSFLIRTTFALEVVTPVTGDFLLQYRAAQDIVANNPIWLSQSFFSTWGYQIPFVYYEALVVKLFESEIALKLLNVLFMTGTNLIVYLLAKEVSTSRAAFITSFLYAIYPSPVLLASVLTNQHISLFFILLGIYFLLMGNHSKHYVLSGVFICIGNLMRPEGILVILSAVIYAAILAVKEDCLKGIISILKPVLLLVLSYVLLSQMSSFLFKVTKASPNGIKNNCPEWKFVLGLDTESKGLYNEKNSYVLNIPDDNERRKESWEIIVHSLQTCKSIPQFFWEKSRIMWGNAETTSWSLLHIERERPVFEFSTDYTYDKAIQLIISFEKILYIIQFILLPFSCLILLKNKQLRGTKALFLLVLICGNFLLYLFIEIQVRYRYFIMPFVFIMGALAIERVIYGILHKNSLE